MKHEIYRSTTTDLFNYVTDITFSLWGDSAHFDFSKAFDSVRYDFFNIAALKIGISGLLFLMDYWLSN